MNQRFRNILLVLAYDGTNYYGWQKQKNQTTVQSVLENKINKITGEIAKLHGAGRTDAGVHALGMTANFTTSANIPCTGLLKGLNSMLPADIRILEVTEVNREFHSRKNASAKTYIYKICNSAIQLPTERLYSLHVVGDINIDVICDCLEIIKGSHDFSSFEKAGSRNLDFKRGKGAVRNIYDCQVSREANEYSIDITFTGDGFLRHMVRNIVGTLLEAGRGRFSSAEFEKILSAKDRSQAGPTAPAHGLYLEKVHYQNHNGQEIHL